MEIFGGALLLKVSFRKLHFKDANLVMGVGRIDLIKSMCIRLVTNR